MVKFLIIRFSSIGDIVLTTPAIRCLKNQVEGAKIYYLTKKKFAGILKANPYIDKIYEYDGNLKKIINEIKNENIHYVIDLHKNTRSLLVKKRLQSVPFSFNKINFQKWLLVNFKINKLPNIHIVDRYLKTLYLFDVKNDNKGLDYFIPEEDEISIKNIHKEFQKGYIAIAIGANHNTKKLPVEKYVELCNKIEFPIILLGGKEDFENGEKIKNSTSAIVLNACGQYNINQSASIVKQCKVLITHDTGLMHIGAAFKKPILSIWGNTIPEFGMYPYLPHQSSIIFEVKNLPCRPCSKLGKQKCPKGHFKCMNEIDINEIASVANNLAKTLH